MARSGLLRKYSFLSRIVITCLLIVGLFALFLGYFLFHRTYNELRAYNELHYTRSARTLSQEFDSRMADFKLHSATFIYQNRETDRRILLSKLRENPYYYYEAVQVLGDYEDTIPDAKLYLCFLDDDIVLTSTTKYTLSQFAAHLGLDLASNEDALRAFLSPDEAGLRLFSTFPVGDVSDAALLCRFPITLNGARCVLVYAIDRAAFVDSVFSARYGEETACYLVRSDGTLIHTNADGFSAIPRRQLLSFLYDDTEDVLHIGDDAYYKHYNATYQMYCLVRLPFSVLDEGLQQFYDTVTVSFLVLLGVLLAMLVLAAYFSYKPIYKLVKRIGRPPSDAMAHGEIASILNAFGEIEDTAAEQKELLLEHMLRSILSGHPIPPDAAACYPAFFASDAFLVCTAAGFRPDSAKRSAMRQELYARTGAAVYVVDILRKNQTALIVLPPAGADLDAITATLQEAAAPVKLGVSGVVESASALFDAYLSSLASLEFVSATVPANGFDSGSDTDGEAYIVENTAIFLEYLKSGDEESALRLLSAIGGYLQREVRTAIYQRYIIYNFLTAYTKLCKSLGVPAEQLNTATLLSYTDVDVMFDAIAENVRTVCAHLNAMRLNAYDSLRRDVVEYINLNYADPDLCRSQIADHFGISVYSLSQIFKDALDMGFKEYVNAKRLTMSKTLLLTTSDSISQIAVRVGFANADYFTKLFRSTFDMTPTKYRELQREIG